MPNRSERIKHLSLAGSSDFAQGKMLECLAQAENILNDLDPDCPQRPLVADLVRKLRSTHSIFSESLAENAPTHGAINLS